MIVEGDLYDVAERIKAIAPYYFVVFNEKTRKYELHSDRERPTKILVFPFEKLDQRCIEHTVMTRVENFDRIIEEMEKHNEKLERDAMEDGKKALSNTLDKVASKII